MLIKVISLGSSAPKTTTRKMLRDDEIEAFIDQNTPVNTKRKTKADLNVFQRWLKENLPLEEITLNEIRANELNQILRSFFITVKKIDGKEYEPDTIKAIQNRGYYRQKCMVQAF